MAKRHAEENHMFTDDETEQFADLLSKPGDWIAELNALQILPYIRINEKVSERINTFVERNVESKNKFIRAWAYQGLYELSKNSPSKLSDLKKNLIRILPEESAAVRARIRKILSMIP